MRSDDLHKLAEETMIQAFRLLLRMPDREKGWLRSGHGMKWPAMVKDVQADYADPDAAPRLQLGKADVERMERAWVHELCYAEAVPVHHQKLFMTVLAAKAGRQPGGFRWEDVGEKLYGRAWGTARCDATTDALRMRYAACLGCIGVRWLMWQAFGQEAA
jgi:hypothetical protein